MAAKKGQKSSTKLKKSSVSRAKVPGTLKCKVCSRNFNEVDLLLKHLQAHIDKGAISKKKLAQNNDLSLHMTNVHNMKNEQQCENDLVSSKKPTPTPRFKCEICQKMFHNNGLLSAHHQVYHVDQGVFDCAVCGKSYDTKMKIIIHLRHHEKQRSKPKKSTVKQKPIGNKQKLTANKNRKRKAKIHHYKCLRCKTSFKQKSEKLRHQCVDISSNCKPFSCPICSMSFALSSGLEIHLQNYTGEKPYKCFKCKNKQLFNHMAQLRAHMKVIHGSDKPFYCTACHSYFKEKKMLIQHKETCSDLINQKENTEALEKENEEEFISKMDISSMRVLLAILIKKISSCQRLEKFEYGKKLIDDVLCDMIVDCGREAYMDECSEEKKRLLKNIEIFMQWTIPEVFMERLKSDEKTIEDILILLTLEPGSWYNVSNNNSQSSIS